MRLESVLLVTVVGWLMLSVSTVSATQTAATISQSTFKKLQKIEKLIVKSSYRSALEKLNALLPNISKVAIEKAIVLKMISSVYALEGHYSKASNALEQSLATKALPADQEQSALINLVQLYIGQGKNKRAADILEPWIQRAEEVSSDDYILLANMYAQLKRYRKALPYVKKAIESAKNPKESWYQLQLALHYELKDYPACANTLVQLIKRFSGKKTYWQQLAAVYQQMKQFKNSAAVKELAYRQGLLTETKDIEDLINVLLYIDAPFRAAKLVKQEIDYKRLPADAKNYELLANAWTQAKEFDLAASAMQKASSLSSKGRLFARLGRIYIEQEKWSEAKDALQKAFKKGDLKNPGNLNILLGIACHELKLEIQARKAFKKALAYKETRKIARQWLTYLNSEA